MAASILKTKCRLDEFYQSKASVPVPDEQTAAAAEEGLWCGDVEKDPWDFVSTSLREFV